jgi:hypothetical protein
MAIPPRASDRYIEKLASAIDSEVIKAKIAEAIFRPLLNPLLEELGKGYGAIVGDKLGKFKVDLSAEIDCAKILQEQRTKSLEERIDSLMPGLPCEGLPQTDPQSMEISLGNLGWDTQPSVLMERASEVLAALAITSDRIESLLPRSRTKPGSVCDVIIRNCTTELSTWQHSLRSLSMTYSAPDEQQRLVWLDRTKTHEQFRPTRQVRKLESFLGECEADNRGGTVSVEMRYRMVKVDNMFMALAAPDGIVWSNAAKARYTEDEMQAGSMIAASV